MPTLMRRPRSHERRGGRLTRPLAVAALATALVAAAPAAAQAQTVTNPDTVGDVVRIDYNTGATTPAPNRANGDVTSTTLTHSATRVSVRVEYAELRRVGAGLLFISMTTNEGAHRIVELNAGEGSGRTDFYRGDGRLVRCAVRHSVDYAANEMRVSFPRRCASNPRWVRFRVAVLTGNSAIYFDDALRDRPLTDEDNGFAQSRRVYRQASS